jgi:hypothetical protein
MRWPGLLKAYKEFLPVNNDTPLLNISAYWKGLNDEKLVTHHIRGVVKG